MSTTLGDFLRTRRGRLSPGDAGIRSYGARRVPGLRREELAQLAGVSVTYYTRLEQGQSHQASWSVVEALADALRLTPDERGYLHRLARPEPAPARPPALPATARPATRQLIEAMPDVAALVVDHRTDVLAWNALGHLLLAGHLDPGAPDRPADRPNLTRMTFRDAHYAALAPDWDVVAACVVAALRITAAHHKDDPRLAGLIGELTMHSEDFAALWAAHPVASHPYGPRVVRHPEVGDLHLELETTELLDGSGHRLVTYSAAPGTPAHHSLRLLKLNYQVTGSDLSP
ncbi:helix-turn-helix transcriptional regulator [Saccharothrix syringae]|uniref:XRE family transcriptional regulator n=1 Tax=Saccharothrix syringae TaxID=103733 RepID=A0A5Q0GWF3_SACSY|nr:helix-turn-helix transcriptional regulator [Saccharothrix syringae]QFZ18223.1 XRE family transcriptional regulator [Saccharothrix syringae]